MTAKKTKEKRKIAVEIAKKATNSGKSGLGGSRLLASLIIVGLAWLLLVGVVFATQWQTKNQSDFDEGTYYQTDYNTTIGAVDLTDANTGGTYVSKIFNAGSPAQWNNISWYGTSFNCGDTLTDPRDGKTYDTVLIGTQCWMAENLNYGTMTAGTNNQGNDCPSVAETEKYCYNNTESNCTSDGALYQWGQAMCGAASCNGTGAPPNDACARPVQGICPPGWHIPSHYEITTLEKNVGSNPDAFPYDESTTGWLGTDEGGNLKGTTVCGSYPCWNSPNTGATNSSGFTAWAAGFRNTDGSFGNRGAYTDIWSSFASGTNAWRHSLSSSRATIFRNATNELYAFSVRCIKDQTVLNLSVRSCNDASCSGETWTNLNDTSPQNLSANGISDNQWFQYRFDFNTNDPSYSPKLYDVNIDYTILNASPDGNITKIDGYADDADLPVFSYVKDGNLTIDFNVMDPDNDRLTADINYSTSSSQGTGTAIIDDLNLSIDEANCDDEDFTDSTHCSWDLNIHPTLVSDNNYFILLVVDDGTATSFNASDNSFMVDNTAPNTVADYNANWQAGDANVTLSCSDGSGSGCLVTKYRLDSDGGSGVSMGAWQTYDTNILITADGNYAIDFYSMDVAQNIEGINRIYVLIDSPPTVKIVHPGNPFTIFDGGTVDFNILYTDAVNWEWDINGDLVYDYSGDANISHTYDANLSGTTYTVTARVTDGNFLTATDSLQLTIDAITVTFNVTDISTSEHLDGLTLTCNGTQLGTTNASPFTKDFNYGMQYCTLTKNNYANLDFNFLADQNKTLNLAMEPITAAEHTFSAKAEFNFQPDINKLTVVSWLERSGAILNNPMPTAAEVKIYDQNTLVHTLNSTSPSVTGQFTMVQTDANIMPGKQYSGTIKITFSGKDYTSGFSFNVQGVSQIYDLNTLLVTLCETYPNSQLCKSLSDINATVLDINANTWIQAADVWNYAVRTLTDCNQSDMWNYLHDINLTVVDLNGQAWLSADDVWNYTNRTLTDYNMATLPEDIWGFSKRTLTDYNLSTMLLYLKDINVTVADINGNSFISAQDMWNYGVRTLTDYNQSTVFAYLADINAFSYDTNETTSNIWLSQQQNFKVVLSDFGKITNGGTYRAKLWVFDFNGNPKDADFTPKMTLYDPVRNIIVQNVDMNHDETGVYSYSFVTTSSDTAGQWEAVASVIVNGSTITPSDWWVLTGNPPKVTINSITDATVPSITADVTLTNEGVGSQEYQYEYCIVSDQTNQCGGSDDEDYASGAKFIQAGEIWNTSQNLTLSKTGTYWFKVKVYYDGETSAASRQFTATAASPEPTSGHIPDWEGRGDDPSGLATLPGAVGEISITEFPSEMVVKQGGFEFFLVKVKNIGKGNLTDLKLGVDGLFLDWYSVEQDKTVLAPNEEASFVIKTMVPLNAELKDHLVKFKVSSNEDSKEAESVLRVLEKPLDEIRFVDVSISRMMVKDSGEIDITLFNNSLKDLNLNISLLTPLDWQIEKKEFDLLLKAGQQRKIKFKVNTSYRSGVQDLVLTIKSKDGIIFAGVGKNKLFKELLVIVHAPEKPIVLIPFLPVPIEWISIAVIAIALLALIVFLVKRSKGLHKKMLA